MLVNGYGRAVVCIGRLIGLMGAWWCVLGV